MQCHATEDSESSLFLYDMSCYTHKRCRDLYILGNKYSPLSTENAQDREHRGGGRRRIRYHWGSARVSLGVIMPSRSEPHLPGMLTCPDPPQPLRLCPSPRLLCSNELDSSPALASCRRPEIGGQGLTISFTLQSKASPGAWARLGDTESKGIIIIMLTF